MKLNDFDANPFIEFDKWFKEARNNKVNSYDSMTLATVDEYNRPSARIVLLKDISKTGFTFFTNYKSRKGKCLEHNPLCALVFFWPEINKQVRIEGKANKLTETESLKYFKTRPIDSQISSWASKQSEILDNRETLLQRFEYFQKKFSNQEIELPKFWGGYIVNPHYFEFWIKREHRLHDRYYYKFNQNNAWEINLLYP